MVERRRSRRFELKLPVELLRVGSVPTRRVGETQNLSSTGVLITTEARIAVGDPLEYLITLPVVNGDGQVRLRCVGKVIRHNGQVSAATLERYEFLRG